MTEVAATTSDRQPTPEAWQIHLPAVYDSDDEKKLMPMDEQYPSIGVMPDARHFILPQHVEVDFDDTFKMPKYVQMSVLGQRAGRPIVGKVFKCVFTWSLDITYHFLAFITGFFLSLAWGITFGAITYTSVWVMQPAWKISHIIFLLLGHIYAGSIRTFVDPVFQSIGLIYSYYRLRLNIVGNSHKLKNIAKEYADV